MLSLQRDSGAQPRAGRAHDAAPVLPGKRLAELADGRRIGYDALVLATGARRVAAYGEGVVTLGRDSEGDEIPAVVGDLLRRSRALGRVRRAARRRVDLPLYELALLIAQRTAGKRRPG